MDLLMRRRAMMLASGGADPWDAVLASIAAGTYATDYAVGDLIPLDMGAQGTVNMEIIAFNSDNLAIGSGKAHITFISQEALTTTKRMNPAKDGTTEGTGTIGGWELSEIRGYYQDTLLPLVPANVRAKILEVTKTYYYYASDSAAARGSCTDKLWMPSYREVFGGSSKESSGPAYSAANSNAWRTKHRWNGVSAVNWWLRTASSTTNWNGCGTSGAVRNAAASTAYSCVVGFCL